jgi:hypothetical protein
MTARQIAKRIQDEADARFGDVIERLLLNLRQRHTHQCWHKECCCDYCRFINGPYVDEKLRLHAMKKWLNRYEYISLTWDHSPDMMKLELDIANQKWRIKAFKDLKKAMQKDIL